MGIGVSINLMIDGRADGKGFVLATLYFPIASYFF